MFPDGLLVREQVSSHAPIDDRNLRRTINVTFIEGPTCDNRSPKGQKIVGCDSEEVSVVILRSRQLEAIDRKPRPSLRSDWRQPAAASCRNNSRNLPDA